VILQAAGGGAVAGFLSPLQALDPSIVTDASPAVRAVAALLASTVLGGFAQYQYGGRLRSAIDASTASPVLSVLYGFIAYGLVGFVVVYGYTQLARLGLGTPFVTALGGIALLGGFLALGGLGYVVLGTWIADTAGLSDPWIGLLGVGLIGALAVLVLPLLLGVVVWFGIAAAGIGGPVRKWVHADAAERRTGEHGR
jgi:hypothetical protein